MHEMSLAINIIDIACSQVQEVGGQAVTEIELQIGPFAGVMQDSLSFCLEVTAKETIAENCQIIFLDPTAANKCPGCRKLYSRGDFWGICPHCREPAPRFPKDQELQVIAVSYDE